LNETYDGALNRLEKTQHQKAIRALTWVAFSQAPLTIVELAAAIPIDLGKANIQPSSSSNQITEEDYSAPLFGPGDIIQDPLQVLYLLPGLYNLQNKQYTQQEKAVPGPVDKLHQVVVLTHFTLLEYLTSDDIKKPRTLKFALNRTIANLQIAEACLRYHVHLSQKGSALSDCKLREEYPLWEYVACHGLRHAENVGRAAWPTSLRKLIRCVLQDGSESFAKLKLCSGYLSRQADDLPIQYAVEKHLLETVAFLLEEKLADVNAKPKFGETPLIHGLTNLDKDIVHLLLNHDADANAKTESGEPALFWATSARDVSMVQLLLEHGADVNASNKRGETALFQATINQDDALVGLLLMQKPDVNAKTKTGETSLHWAACYGNEDLVSCLLELGANVDSKTETGETPLLWAADAQQDQVVHLLLKHSPDLNAKNEKGERSLHLAAREGNTGMVRLLLENGADVNAMTNTEETALHFAAKTTDNEILELLLEHGADVNAANETGETALYLVARNLTDYDYARENLR
jgi:ankyrin repeat protein